MVDEDEKSAAIEYLVNDITAKHNGHLSTGIFGTKYMLDVLSQQGEAKTAYGIVNQKDFPGWANMIDKGATTLWEHWKFSDNTFSHNHPMFGSVSEWFYKHVAGIQIDAGAVGFDKFTIYPKLVDTLDWAKATYRSVRGPITSNWRKKEGNFFLDVTVPVNTTATVCIPTGKVESVTENNRPAKDADGVTFVRFENNIAVYNVKAGTYRFSSKLASHY